MGCGSSTMTGDPQSTQHHHQRQPQQQHRQYQNQHKNNTQSFVANIDKKLTDKEIDHIEIKEIPIDKNLLDRYMKLETEIYSIEKKNPRKTFNIKSKELEDLKQTTDQLQEHVQRCKQETAKEKADVDQMQDVSVKRFFADQGQYDEKLSKEQEEYLNAVNKQEVAQKELNGVRNQKELVEIEVRNMKDEVVALQELYREQDELLAGVFGGTYGSNTEDMLEKELDGLLERKQRISVARYKWQNGRTLLQYAVNQLSFSARRWQELATVHPQNMQARLVMATEVRNNLIAATRNISSTGNYLSGVTFPYCTPSEMQTLTTATNNIYTDMQTQERHAHAYQCYVITHKRAAALLQWFDYVIAHTIDKDLAAVAELTQKKSKELRTERINMIKEKITATHGDSVSFGDLDMDRDVELSDDGAEPELTALAMEPDAVSQAGDIPPMDGEQTSGPEAGDSAPTQATPLPLNELAPPPKTEDLFGNIDELKKQHEKEQEEFSKTQEVNKARMEQGLQDKLKNRRSRRRRQQINEDQQQQQD